MRRLAFMIPIVFLAVCIAETGKANLPIGSGDGSAEQDYLAAINGQSQEYGKVPEFRNHRLVPGGENEADELRAKDLIERSRKRLLELRYFEGT